MDPVPSACCPGWRSWCRRQSATHRPVFPTTQVASCHMPPGSGTTSKVKAIYAYVTPLLNTAEGCSCTPLRQQHQQIKQTVRHPVRHGRPDRRMLVIMSMHAAMLPDVSRANLVARVRTIQTTARPLHSPPGGKNWQQNRGQVHSKCQKQEFYHR